VIDCTGAKTKADQTVLIIGDRIQGIGRSDKLKIPRSAQIVDATGKFLIPGLWDMHVHWYDTYGFSLFVANGVTGIREMFGFPSLLDIRKDITAGALVGPRMVVASPIVDGPNPIWPDSIVAGNANEGRQAVIKAKADGYDFVKVYSLLPRDAYLAIADQARESKIPFAGHVPSSITATEAAEAGQRSIEHLDGILISCSTREDEMRKIGRTASIEERRNKSKVILDTLSRSKAKALFANLKRNHVWQCPTLNVLRSMANLDDPGLAEDPRLKYVSREIRDLWNPKNDFRLKSRTAEDYALAKKTYQKQVEVVGEMRRSGLEFLAGTDVLNPYCFPGFSLHDELSLLVGAGLTPMEALQSATRNPARFLGMGKEVGTVQKGKLADLVLLDADPLLDIRNTTKITAVIVNGRLLDRSGLDKLLADASISARNGKP
jgi:imidazolonepropionase-like amidohydrolase